MGRKIPTGAVRLDWCADNRSGPKTTQTLAYTYLPLRKTENFTIETTNVTQGPTIP